MRLAAVSPEARRLGLAPGMTLADARAQVPDLAVHDHDPEADLGWLDRLAGGGLRYTPMVAGDPPDGLLLDITGCAHLFGGEQEVERDAGQRLTKLGMDVRCARAGTAEAARALARYGNGKGEDALHELPVAALRLDPEAELGLRRAGLKTLGDVARRPRAAIAARFGEAAVTALRRLLGEARGPLDPRLAEPPVSLLRRFAEPVARTGHVLAALEELAGEAVSALERRERGGRRFEALLFRADGLVRRLAVETGRATRDVAAVMRLLNERIDGLSDPIDPGFGFDAVRLTVPRAEPLAPAQLPLEGGETGEGEVAALLDRLSTRLGRGRVRRFAPAGTHVPEQLQIAFPAVEQRSGGEWPVSGKGDPPMRPLHLFDPPEPISVIAEVPDGPPRRFRWRRTLRDVTRYEGPERIASEWWRARGDPLGERRLTRDYYRIEDSAGRRYWVFRHGLVSREKPDPRWYLHGLFA